MNSSRRIGERQALDADRIAAMAADGELRELARQLFVRSCEYGYSYNFSWLGRPIIQFPQDILAIQEIVWRTRPDLIVETGVAHGGSLVLYASLLELLGGDGLAIGIDVDLRQHNRRALEQHPLARRIRTIVGSSIDPHVVEEVRSLASGRRGVMVTLDSHHTSAHVLEELRLYSPLVTPGSYLVVFDTVIEDMPEGSFPDRPWRKGDNPRTAVQQFLAGTDRFVVDTSIDDKLLLSVAPGGYLRCVKELG